MDPNSKQDWNTVREEKYNCIYDQIEKKRMMSERKSINQKDYYNDYRIMASYLEDVYDANKTPSDRISSMEIRPNMSESLFH